MQLMGNIISLPEINVALVQMPYVPNEHGNMFVNFKQPDQHYTYIDLTKFVWSCRAGMWRRRAGVHRFVSVDWHCFVVNNNNNNNNLIYIAPACRMTSEALVSSPSLV